MAKRQKLNRQLMRLPKNCLIIGLTCSCPPATRKGDIGKIDLKGCSPKMAKLVTKLWESEHYDRAKSITGQARSYMRHMSVPASFIGSSFYLVRSDGYTSIRDTLEDYNRKLKIVADAFRKEYANMIEQAKKDLGPQFREDYYKKPNALKFNIDHVVVPWDLSNVDDELREVYESAAQRLDASLRNAETIVAQELSDLCNSMAEQLVTGKKAFQSSAVNNLREFFRNFPFRNITDSADLEKLCQKAEALLDGRTVLEIKNAASLDREKLRKGMQDLQKEVLKTIVNKPVRKISIKED